MNIHEINTRGKYKVKIGHPMEGFLVQYEENSSKGGLRRLTVEVAKCHKNWFWDRREKFKIFLDSFEYWKIPEGQELTLQEYQTVLKRVINHLKSKDISCILE